MVFLGTTFFSGELSLYPPATKQDSITSIGLSDGTYNQLYVSKNTDNTANNWEDDWNMDTVMNATYDENLDAGNSGFSLRNTDTIVIRRRELTSSEWVTIYTKEINKIEDFDINILYRYARGGDTKYVFRISSTLNGIENSYVEQEIISRFEGLCIADNVSIYGTPFDLNGCDTSLNLRNETSFGYSKYATVVSNSDVCCEQGSITGSFIKMDNDNCTLNEPESLKYRNNLKERLASKKPFILKMPDGRIWLAKCIGNPTDSMNAVPELRQITFEWIEIGDVNDVETLYYCGLTDVMARWWVN